MTSRQGRVRAIVICVFRRGDRLLVAQGYDSVKKQVFYRPLGGSIEFGEYSKEAIVREIREELAAEIVNLRYLGTLETVFTHEGQPGHEIVLIYEADFADGRMYGNPYLEGEEGGIPFKAVWQALDDFKSGETPLYPEGLLELLTRGGEAKAGPMP